MIKRMHARVMFDREFVKDYHSIMPGGRDGYEMKFGDNAVCFEFRDFYGYVDKTDPRVMDIEAENLDIETCPEGSKITAEYARKLNEIIKFSVDTGDEDNPETPELHARRLLGLVFEFDDGTVVDCSGMDAVKNYIFDNVFINECYEAYKLDWMLSHGYTLHDIMEVMTELAGQAIEDDVMTIPTNGEEVISLANRLVSDFLDTGFGSGSLYACMNEFLNAEFLDKEYMRGLFAHRPETEDMMMSKWKTYTQWEGIDPSRVMVFSTSHITKETADELEDFVVYALSGRYVYEEIDVADPRWVTSKELPEELKDKDCQWWIHISKTTDEDNLHVLKEHNANLFDCIEYAEKQGCDWICFSKNADTVEDLPIYEW